MQGVCDQEEDGWMQHGGAMECPYCASECVCCRASCPALPPMAIANAHVSVSPHGIAASGQQNAEEPLGNGVTTPEVCTQPAALAGRAALQPTALAGRVSLQPPEGWAQSATMPVCALGSGPRSSLVVIKTPMEGSDNWAPLDVTRAVLDMTGCFPALVLNLSNTAKYYAPSAFGGLCPVRWLRQRGGGALPSEREVSRFLGVLSRARGPVVVHCTHGQNRSGYFVVQFLVRQCGYTPADALAAFAQARPPGILRDNYVNAILAGASAHCSSSSSMSSSTNGEKPKVRSRH